VAFPEVCNNGIDDDNNGLTDCDDPACATSASCAGRCTSASSLSCNTPLVGQRTDGTGSTSRIGPPDYSCTFGSYPAPERAHRLFPTAGDTVFLEAYGFDANLGLFLVAVNSGKSCDATLACTAASDVAGLDPEVLKFTAAANKDYYVIVDGATAGSYSLVARCASAELCNPTIAIQAGQTISGTTATSAPNVTQALAQDAATEYSCRSTIHLGPEAAYMFTPTTTGSYRVDVTNLSGNVSLFVLSGPACGTTCLDPTSQSVNATTQPETVTFSAVADTTYYFVVDSFNSTPLTFDISVTAL
jgi:hypothetical protein